MIAHSATARRTHPATKWRNDVAMGVSPWNENPHHTISPKGTTGNPACAIHVAPSGLRVRFDLSIHGFAPVATTCRPFETNVLTSGRVPYAEEVEGLTRELATQFHESEKLQAAIRFTNQLAPPRTPSRTLPQYLVCNS